jgi:hypothetical protein
MRGLLSCLSIFALSCASASGGEGEPDAFPGRADGAPEADGGPIIVPDAGGPSACDLTLQTLGFDFEGSDEGFVHNQMQGFDDGGVTWTFDHWDRGAANTTCPEGQDCFGTNLTGNYIQCQRAYLVSPPIDLSDCGTAGQDLTLSFKHNYDFWTGDFPGGTTWFDGGTVEVSSNGTTWVAANVVFPGTIAINPDMGSGFACVDKNNFYVDGKNGYVGSSGGWVTESIEIPSSIASVTFQIRFVYAAGVSSQTTNQVDSMNGTEPGWYIDDIAFQ